MTGWQMLFYKEVLRFWKVGFQTVAAPVITAILYMMIFGHVLEGRVQVYGSLNYTAFLLPGLVMMSVLQNAFANSSSSIIQSKIMGNMVFLLLTPLSHRAWFVAYVGSSVVRGLAVGAGVMLVTWWFARTPFVAPLWILAFGLLGAALLGALGLIAGLWAEKFDQMAAFQNFVIMPMTFLSGVFYSIHSLPDVWQTVSHFNPFFYMIDGFRFGFFGISDVSPWLSLALVSAALAGVSALALHLLRSGYKIVNDSHPSIMTAEQLQQLIKAGLACEHIEVTGDGRHWSAVIVSPEFAGLRPIARHQRVYATLGERIRNDEVHALSMKTFTPAEWALR